MKQAFHLMRLAAMLAALGLGACAGEDRATATLEPRGGSTTTGTATFREEGDTVRLTLEVAGATPGLHGAHIHETGDCSAPDATSAGGHWNPTSRGHGAPGSPMHHLGDLGNLEVGADGTGTLTRANPEWTVGGGGSTDVVGKALIVHADPDDLSSQPAGNSGARVACGVIRRAE